MTANASFSDPGSASTPAVQVPNPKLSRRDREQTLYPYYAGFSEDFVEAALSILDVNPGDRVLDPWNGSGTTTLISSKRGVLATGVDLSPVQTEVAIARSARIDSVHLAESLLHSNGKSAARGLKSQWANPFEAISIFEKKLKSRLNNCCGQDQSNALINVGIFRAIRTISSSARSQNPTWFKDGINPDATCDQFEIAFFNSMQKVFTFQTQQAANIKSNPLIVNADFAEWPEKERKYDAIITSPPYLTRIDYVRATYPEISYYAFNNNVDIAQLRLKMLGTPITLGLSIAIPDSVGAEASRVLELIRSHSSKASATYYYRFYGRYLSGLAFSIARISSLLRNGGGAAIVVQTSQYKELLINLPKIVCEMGEKHGLEVRNIWEFPKKQSINSLNTRSLSSKHKLCSTESVVIFRKIK